MSVKCYDNNLNIGSSCIIVIDTVNSPTGIWWGTITTKNPCDDLPIFTAKITNGRFKMNDDSLNPGPIHSTECKNTVPNVNYSIFPNNELTQTLFRQQQQLEQRFTREKYRADSWKTMHVTTIAQLISQGVEK